ncbi:MAG: flagellar hook-associated protein FlgL [Oryzomonas sp.]|uniref:flagellar hook-associated protein FlgL n=1 Tax=Oryzomonas sp. TaxID=2855186 RepID=UPI00284DA224|nr:flagellar hook-associated protein FlgL [Oryzomonas sp.]MDR3579102.1 flagellar hook-associated protein FlgL [Oryzomonas sp.]
MRITSNMTANNTIYNLQNAQTTLNNLTELVTSGQNVNQPSDNPAAMNTLLNANDSINALNQYATNSTLGTTTLQTTSNALSGISSVISQAEELAGSISSGTTSTTTQQSAIQQLTSLKQQLIGYGNTQSGNTYVLGGTDTSTPPFSTSSNTYSGNSNQSEMEIAPNVNQSVSFDGSSVLLGTGSYGSTNILQSIDNLITAVGANNVTGIQQGASDLESAATQVNNAQVDVSARLTTFSNMSTMNTNNLNTLQSVIDNIQTVNMTQVGVELEQQQTGYSAALAATEQVSQLSLLNYM